MSPSIGGEWRTLRRPPAPPEVREALATLLHYAAAEAREGHGTKAIDMRRAIDTLHDFVTYEPRKDD